MARSDFNSNPWRELGKPGIKEFPHVNRLVVDVGGKPGIKEFPHVNRLVVDVGGKPGIKEFPHEKKVGGKPTYYVREKRGLPSRPFSFPSVTNQTALHVANETHRKLTSMDRISLTLPYPPSVNHYWKTRVVRRGARYMPSVYVSEDGQRYQESVHRLLDGVPRFSGPVRVQILVRPPDQRLRDLDNILKCLLDSLTKAGVWDDDSQVASLLVVRGDQADGGAVLMIVEEVI